MTRTCCGCKPYFVADVNLILPLKFEPTAKNRSVCRIIKLSVQFFTLPDRSGGMNANTCPIQLQKRKLAPVRNAQLASRAGPRCVIPDKSLFRPVRFAPGQIRDAAPGASGRAAGGNCLLRIWLLAHEFFPTTQTVPGRWVVWPPAPGEGTTPVSQVIRRFTGLYRGNLASRARPAHTRLAGAREREIQNLHPLAQHRTSAGQSEKKSSACQKLPLPLPFTQVRSASECLLRYELLRCQALEAGEPSSSLALEMAFIERQGLAAWIAADWNRFSATGENEVGETTLRQSSHDLVLALVELVIGDREASAHG